MSSTTPRPLRISVRTLITSRMSELAVGGDQARTLRRCAHRSTCCRTARLLGGFLAAHATVELHAADRGQVVALEGEEQVVEQVLRGILGRRLAGRIMR